MRALSVAGHVCAWWQTWRTSPVMFVTSLFSKLTRNLVLYVAVSTSLLKNHRIEDPLQWAKTKCRLFQFASECR